MITPAESPEFERIVNTGARERVPAEGERVLDELLAVLANAPDPHHALHAAARAFVPAFADGCVIDALDAEDSPRFRTVAAAHRDPAGQRVLLLAASTATGSDASVLAATLRDGRAHVVEEAGANAGVPLHPELLPDIAFDARSVLCVPVIYAGRTVGAVTLWRELDAREYTATHASQVERVAPVLGAILEGSARSGTDARERNELLSVVSHEVGTPLGTMQLQVESALRRCRREAPGPVPTDWLIHKLEAAQQQSRRLGRLLETVLHACQSSTGPLAVRREAMDLVAVVRGTVERHRDELAWAKCDLTLESPETAPGRWDPVRVEQVVTNLLTNAMKYGAGRPVTVRVEADELGARILVGDGGAGMDQEEQARVFARFARGTALGPTRGFGLGLWVVRTIAEAHGGSVSVASRRGAGSTFVVSLPAG